MVGASRRHAEIVHRYERRLRLQLLGPRDHGRRRRVRGRRRETAAATAGVIELSVGHHLLTTIRTRAPRSIAYHLGIRSPRAPRLRIDLGGGGQ